MALADETPGQRARRLENKAHYRERHRERLAAKQREYIALNAEANKARKKAAYDARTDEQRERDLAYARERYATRPEVRAKLAAYQRAYFPKNKEKINARRRCKSCNLRKHTKPLLLFLRSSPCR